MTRDNVPRASSHGHGGPSARAARAELLTRIVGAALDTARPPLASNERSVRLALDELVAMAKGLAGPCHGTCDACDACNAFEALPHGVAAQAGPVHVDALSVDGAPAFGQMSATDADNDETVRRLACAAGLPEIGALDLRRGNGQAPTVREVESWTRLPCFAAPSTASARAVPQNTSTPGAGPVAAI